MNREPLMSLQVMSRSCRALVAVVTLLALAACSGGAATQVNQVSSAPTNSAQNYSGPAPANADVQAFKDALWQNVIPSDRCGGCHHQGGQSPMFARTDDVNLAYQAAGPLVSLISKNKKKKQKK